MTDMVERVARALCARAYPGTYGPDSVSAYDWMHHLRDEYNEVARIAIEAMREPSEGMSDKAVFAARLCVDQHEGEVLISASVGERVWQAMIDAALSQSGEG